MSKKISHESFDDTHDTLHELTRISIFPFVLIRLIRDHDLFGCELVQIRNASPTVSHWFDLPEAQIVTLPISVYKQGYDFSFLDLLLLPNKPTTNVIQR